MFCMLLESNGWVSVPLFLLTIQFRGINQNLVVTVLLISIEIEFLPCFLDHALNPCEALITMQVID